MRPARNDLFLVAATVLAATAARADEPARRNLRAARFTVGTSVGAGARPGTLSLRLSVTPEPVQPPIVQLQEAGAPRPRLVTVTRDPGGGYSGAIEDLAPDPNATLLVWVIGAEGQVETHLGGFRVRAVGTRALDPLHSGSGELSLYLAEPEKLGATTRVLVSTSEAVVPSLPPGTRVVSGPVSLVNLDQPPGAAPADLKALLVMRLPAGGAARPDEHGIWWLDPASGRWQAIPGATDKKHQLVSADVRRLGTYLLASTPAARIP